MDVPTYQELLAEMYDESAKNILVHQQEEYDDDEVGPEDNHSDELENQEDFQKFGGSRQQVEIQHNTPNYVDKTKLSVTYEKDVQTRVINVDSRFRYQPNELISSESTILKVPNTSTSFHYKFLNPIKNVVSVRLSSIEIPNTFYIFSERRGSTRMRIYYPSGQINNYYDVSISEGNYIVDVAANTVPNNLIYELETKLNMNTLGLNFSCIFNMITSRLTISETTFKAFDIDFITNNQFAHRLADWGLGYLLGYRKKTYLGLNSYTTEAIVDALDGNYLFLNLNPDWKVVNHTNSDTSILFSFAKILITSPKNTIIYDNGANLLTKEFWFDKPETIRYLNVNLTDSYGNIIDLMGQEMSFSLEFKEVMNHSLYKLYLNQQQPGLAE